MQDCEFGLKLFFLGVLVLLPSSCDLVLLWSTSDGCRQDSQRFADCGFDCEQRAWLKEEQTPDFFPTGRLVQ